MGGERREVQRPLTQCSLALALPCDLNFSPSASRDSDLQLFRFSLFSLFSTTPDQLRMADQQQNYCLGVNCGSSSIKFKVYRTRTQEVVVAGSASNVQGSSPAKFSFKHAKPDGDIQKLDQSVDRQLDSSTSYQDVFEEILRDVTSAAVLGEGGKDRITVIAHRIVHGGTAKQPVVIRHGDKGEEETLKRMDEVSDFAPLHVSLGSADGHSRLWMTLLHPNRTTTPCSSSRLAWNRSPRRLRSSASTRSSTRPSPTSAPPTQFLNLPTRLQSLSSGTASTA